MSRPKGIEIRPEAVRSARLEAGLTLAAVAGDQLSRAAIHLIEAGRARPSRKTLELIAERTGKPVAWFVAESEVAASSGSAQDTRLAELERLAAAEQFDAVIAAGCPLLSEALPLSVEVDVRLALGEAHVQQANPASALEHLLRARDLLRLVPDTMRLADCLDWEAKSLHQQEDPRAAGLFEQALDMCRSIHPVPAMLEARILGHIGALHAGRHDWAEAITSYEDAVRAADVVKDLGQLAKMYNDLCFAYEEIGDFQRASSYSQRALALTEITRDRRAMARLQNNLGRILLRQHKYAPAKAALDASLLLCDELDLRLGRSHVLLSLAEYEQASGDPDAAGRIVAEAIELSQKLGEKMTLSSAHEAMADLCEERGASSEADRHFKTALSLLEELNSEARLVEAHRKYAEMLEKRGDAVSALSHAKVALDMARLHGGTSSEARAAAQSA